MNSISNETKPRFALQKKESAKKKKMMLHLQKEIDKLDDKVQKPQKANLKISTVKNLKISLRFIQLITPYIVTAGIAIGGLKLIGTGLPFYRDTVKKNLNIMKEFDSLGNIRYEQQYEDFNYQKNTLTYFSMWQLNSDGTYSRTRETYDLNRLTEDEINKLFDSGNLKISDILGKPILEQKQSKYHLNEKELQQKAYLQATIYSEDKNDYILCKEDIEFNAYMTFLHIVSIVCLEIAIPFLGRRQVSSFDFGYSVLEIQKQYPPIDIKKLKKELALKKSNYERLVR